MSQSSRLRAGIARGQSITEAREMKVRVSQTHIDHRQAFEVVADYEVVDHPHGSVHLHGLLSDESRRLSDVGFGARNRVTARAGIGDIGVDRSDDGHRADLFLGDVHVRHAVLQRLEGADGHAKLLAALKVREGRLVQHPHDTGRFCTQRRRRRIHRAFENPQRFPGCALQRRRLDPHLGELHIRGATSGLRGKRHEPHSGGGTRHEEQAHAVRVR
jgi:hypothetical protein